MVHRALRMDLSLVASSLQFGVAGWQFDEGHRGTVEAGETAEIGCQEDFELLPVSLSRMHGSRNTKGSSRAGEGGGQPLRKTRDTLIRAGALSPHV